ncbi:hypothetical protein HPP92_001018 [Vanilla planifolia]|uniref:Protein N-terminal glutamine amidohydrolase n=1 Tax=Vanilla planifolia TaxID=51239 RepID=A0A835VEZ0_VANPL|nr:hypothetical protein HPP92_001018 [Vanilla planifolia]
MTRPRHSLRSRSCSSDGGYVDFGGEENVYMLCKKLSALGLADPVVLDLFVVFISNDHRMTPLWHQKASKSLDGLVIWDYHVLCIQKKGEQGFAHCLTWDLDSSLPFPLGLDKYVSEAIRPMFPLTSTYRRLFRVIHAPIFLNYFASNRAHMKDPLGNWVSPPPSYEPIIAQDGCQNNLQEYIGMHAVDVVTDIKALSEGLYSNKFGVLIDEAMLETFFSFVLWQ